MKNLKKSLSFYSLYLGHYGWWFVLMLVGIILYAAAASVAPVFLGYAVADLTTFLQHWQAGKAASLDTFMNRVAVLAALYTISAFGDWLASMVLSWVGGKATGDMRVDLFAKIQRLPVRYFDAHSDGDLLSRFTSDLDNIFNAVNQVFIALFYSAAEFIGVLYMMFNTNAEMGVVTMLTTPVAIIIAVFNIRRAAVAVDRQQDDIGKLNGYINEQITGQKVIITNGLQQDSIAGFDKFNNQVRVTALRGQIWSGMLQPLMNGLGLLNTAIVIFFGSWLVINGSMGTGAALALIVVFVQFSQQYYQPISTLTSLYSQMQLAITGARRVNEVLDAVEEVRPENGQPLNTVRTGVQIEDVHFGYNADTEILHGVNITAARGEMVALVGPTGAGKTTVMNLLNRFYDVTGGHIRIDGVDVRDYDMTALRDTVGIILQDPQLFTGTIADNIRFGKPDASQAEIVAAATQANIHDFITGLPDGYETKITDEQSVFSAGQRQLVSIARTILTNPPILIMDEATSNVDTVTEARIQTAMNNVVAGRTSFVIAHRLQTVVKADQIVVLRDGIIVERGNHHALITADGFYAELYRNQTAGI